MNSEKMMWPKNATRFGKRSTEEWTFLTSMNRKRLFSASSPVKTSLFVTGGRDENDIKLSTTEYIGADGTITAGPPLPSALHIVWLHCPPNKS